MSVVLLQALEEYSAQEASEQNGELESKMEVARQSLRRAEVSLWSLCAAAPDCPLLVRTLWS